MDITEVTRRDIADRLTSSRIPWSGRLGEVPFLKRLFDLDALPSQDHRFQTACEDISQHCTNNAGDWPDDWIFTDRRFNLLDGADETFLRFLTETLHPLVRLNADEVKALQNIYNDSLAADGFELIETGTISGRPTFGSRRIIPQAERSNEPVRSADSNIRKLPRPLVCGISRILGNWYASHRKLDRLFQGCNAPGEVPEGNLIEKAQTWLNRVNNEEGRDAIEFLSELLVEMMSQDRPSDSRWLAAYNETKRVLEKHAMEYDISGTIVPLSSAPSGSNSSSFATPVSQASKSGCKSQRSPRFAVAITFPGECRPLVLDVATAVAAKVGPESVFYDQWYEHELARPNLDIYLQDIYSRQASLVVVVLCAEYAKKEWCGLEWRAVRELIKKGQSDRIMFIRTDDATVDGTFSIDGYVDARRRSKSEIGELIMRRLEGLEDFCERR